jgi:transcription elongation GreA/GreB family factor
MSRAFVREDDSPGDDPLPERPVSPHPNFVTPEGLARIDAELAGLQAALAEADADDRDTRARIERDLRYWQARRASAEVVVPPETDEVRFGSTVTIVRDDGRTQTWRIVGEDEADPAQGTLSYVSPLARALVGHVAGDSVTVGGRDVEIVTVA